MGSYCDVSYHRTETKHLRPLVGPIHRAFPFQCKCNIDQEFQLCYKCDFWAVDTTDFALSSERFSAHLGSCHSKYPKTFRTRQGAAQYFFVGIQTFFNVRIFFCRTTLETKFHKTATVLLRNLENKKFQFKWWYTTVYNNTKFTYLWTIV